MRRRSRQRSQALHFILLLSSVGGNALLAQPDTWTQKASLSSGRDGSVAFTINGKGYFVGGQFGNNETWEYDPTNNNWTLRAPFPGTEPYNKGFSIGNAGYVLENGTTNLWCYQPASNTWSPKTPFPGIPRLSYTTMVIDGKGYAGMGKVPFGAPLIDWYEYDPLTDSWTGKAEFPGYPRAGASPVR